MRLLALHIHHFRRFQEAVYVFDPRLNVLVGPNEAGKSTVRQAILTAFFVNPATTARRVESWRPWGSESLGAITLEFEAEGRRFELRKDFEHRRAQLRDLHQGRTWEGARAQERMLQALGLSTEALYRSTAMVEQAEIASLRVGAADIGARLSRVVQAGPGDAEAGAVLRRLERELTELERGLDRPVKNPGVIRRLQEEVEGLQAQQAELQRRITRLDAQREELKRLRGEAEAAARELRDREALLQANRDVMALQAQLDPLRAREGALAERVAAIEKGYLRLQELGRDLEILQSRGVPDDSSIARLHTAAGAVQSQRQEVQRRQVELRAAQEAMDALASTPAVPRGVGVLPGLLLLAGAVAAALGAARVFTVPVAVLLVAILAGGAALLGVARQRRAGELRREREAAAARVEEVERGLRAARHTLAEQEETLRTVLAATGSATPEQAEQRQAQMRQLFQEQAAVRTMVEALLGGRTLEDLREELGRVRADIAGREVVLQRPEVAAKRLGPLQVQQLEHQVSDLTRRVHALQARREHLEREAAEGTPDYEGLMVVEEQLAERREALEAARRRARVWRAAKDGLQTARQQALIPARRLVEERAGEYLSLLTLGAYDRVRIEEPPLRVWVWVPQAGAWLEPAEPSLSRGTADQAYLAVRLALVEVLAEGSHPPLLLDDPFGTFDQDRLRAAMALLRRISESHQVLLFTCRQEYEPFADRVIAVAEEAPPQLPGPLWQPPPPAH
ncbi:MAG: AAA family ATPase [Armatimonadota bacterium]|nr:AAA family ATPase [Armatimonadota bacterium]MDR7426828.1 AAA family ATPase [Armatimonadota bacterium]MDR7464281.1 AAA family ATPase [Armatimonadota bacterium]MDR7468775.1 AAA family ATPase [Armatimonadota bacterium]MDR7473704.1 AAA family ATPase [Armatimonadota bacterium]